MPAPSEARTGLRERVRGAGALGAEHEGQLTLRLQPTIGGSVGGARRLELERAQHVLPEVAALALQALLPLRPHSLRCVLSDRFPRPCEPETILTYPSARRHT